MATQLLAGHTPGRVSGWGYLQRHSYNKWCEKTARLPRYANGTKVTNAVKIYIDAALLQENLEIIYEWTTKNNMQFIAGKFQAFHYQPYPVYPLQQSYVFDTVRELGIKVSNIF